MLLEEVLNHKNEISFNQVTTFSKYFMDYENSIKHKVRQMKFRTSDVIFRGRIQIN